MVYVDLALVFLLGFIVARLLGQWQMAKREEEWLATVQRFPELDRLPPLALSAAEFLKPHVADATDSVRPCRDGDR